MPRTNNPDTRYEQIFKPKETILDRTTSVAMQIVEQQQRRQHALSAKLKTARLKKEAAEAACSATVG